MVLARWLLAFLVCATVSSAVAARSLSEVDGVMPTVQEAYRLLHENPEVGLKETRAHDFVLSALESLHAFRFETVPKLPTAVIAVLDTGRAGPTVGWRSELKLRPLGVAKEGLGKGAIQLLVDLMHLGAPR